MRHANMIAGALASLLLAAGLGQAQASEHQEVEINKVNADGVGEAIGTVTLEDTDYGLLLTPDLSGLSPGPHGFHVHENASCGPDDKTAAAEAGGHYDPDETGSHEGPYGDGHLGDLPVLIVNADGKATLPVLAPRLSLDDLKARSLMIHEGSDNYADEPKPLGGGGARVACGVLAS
ncbi:superoxide dismutase family protein [Halomonas cerina]|uniref:Cu-Zn family superoxide dismutase n=1 Tax=Halomonas cerina TaxID=447424 RepID=A0A839VD08_9GAMM|nr:superoxide dismutase family protein [Halomonas cerina]MBB3192008.1 Cu-Zn family superoxide dismutase [Halomonas cerina]